MLVGDIQETRQNFWEVLASTDVSCSFHGRRREGHITERDNTFVLLLSNPTRALVADSERRVIL
jgi:hypothetical protein